MKSSVVYFFQLLFCVLRMLPLAFRLCMCEICYGAIQIKVRNHWWASRMCMICTNPVFVQEFPKSIVASIIVYDILSFHLTNASATVTAVSRSQNKECLMWFLLLAIFLPFGMSFYEKCCAYTHSNVHAPLAIFLFLKRQL